MSQSIQALRERRNALAQELHTLLDENPGAKWTPAHQSTYDAKLGEIDVADKEIGRITAVHEKMADDAIKSVGAQLEHDNKGKSSAREVFGKWLKGGDRALSAMEWADIRATMSTTTNSQGGYSVQTEVAKMIVDALKLYGGMRAVSEQITTEGFGPLNFPTSDGTGETGEVIAENTTATALDPSFGVATVTAYKFSSKIIAIPYELLQDSAVDMEAFVRQRIVTRLGRIQNTKFTLGTGTAEPYGVVTQATSGATGTTGQTVTVIFDDLINLIHSVDPAYRALPNCVFMMADSSLKVLRKIKDTQNRPIFLPGYDGLANRMADSLLGYPIQINQDVAAMAANAKSILFGPFSKFMIRDVMGLTLFRFDDSAYAKLGQVGFLAWQRAGSNLLDTSAIKYYANSAT